MDILIVYFRNFFFHFCYCYHSRCHNLCWNINDCHVLW